jgi:hypothetical protein
MVDICDIKFPITKDTPIEQRYKLCYLSFHEYCDNCEYINCPYNIKHVVK